MDNSALRFAGRERRWMIEFGSVVWVWCGPGDYDDMPLAPMATTRLLSPRATMPSFNPTVAYGKNQRSKTSILAPANRHIKQLKIHRGSPSFSCSIPSIRLSRGIPSLINNATFHLYNSLLISGCPRGSGYRVGLWSSAP